MVKKIKGDLDFSSQILGQFKNLVEISMKSVKEKINPQKRVSCFQIFGYDFIIDYNLHVWLIEINTNPCLEESSPLLKMLIPRMLGKKIVIYLK